MIINISAKIKSGKDLTGQIIQHLVAWSKNPIKDNYLDDVMLSINNNANNSNSGWDINKYADKLKDTVCLWLNCTREKLEDRDFKENPLGEEWWVYKVQAQKVKNDLFYLINYYDNPDLSKLGRPYELIKTSPRILLQLLGTDAGRDIINPNLWVITSLMGYSQDKNWIMTDNRFPNECKAVDDRGGFSIRLERDIDKRFPGFKTESDIYDTDPELYKVITHFGETALDKYDKFKYLIYNNGSIEELITEIYKILIKENII